MAHSNVEYVRDFEQPDPLLRETWIVVRIDGRAFTQMCSRYNFEKPNDKRALDLMNSAAIEVVRQLPDITIAYGQSDEYSFVFHRSTKLFERRSFKLVTTVVSTFTAYYVGLWRDHFPDVPLKAPFPTFDGRAVCYPTDTILRDYMKWRQVDCHINNLFNTTFWSLVQLGGMSNSEAEEALKGTVSGDKNEILFSRFGINYNNEPEIFKKGSVVFRDYEIVEPNSRNAAEAESRAVNETQSKSQANKDKKLKAKAKVVVEHLDIIKDDFWEKRPWILSNKPGKIPKET